uniref:C2 domain-containing protein n=1 Tax=Ditylenchus dipsaci TaxID=166011 RepID=A0A915E4X4_9BILA
MMTPYHHTSTHFLDPSTACHRRQLPATPFKEEGEGFLPTRRGSSPRATVQFIFHIFQGVVMSPPPEPSANHNMLLERRPSSGRRLPPEPILAAKTMVAPAPVVQERSFAVAPPAVVVMPLVPAGAGGVLSGGLQRSSSTRNPSHSLSGASGAASNRPSHQLPPMPVAQSFEASNHRLARMSSSSSSSAATTADSGYSVGAPCIPSAVLFPPQSTAASTIVQPTSSNSSAAMSKRQSTVPEPRIQLPPPSILQTPSSAPQTPRNSAGDANLSANGVGYVPQRKFSDAFDTNSANSRNGSMAYLLEQQHILRREFTSTPDSAVNSARSNSSSLSPSIEQLNCNGGSKSGSDFDESSMTTAAAASGAACMDARVHGLDPSLYGGAAAATRLCCPAIASSATTAVVSASSSWQNAENEPRPKGLGLIHCTLQHFPVRKRLRVSVLKIEGLAGELRPELEIQPFCKVNIQPGTKQKQLSVVKRGRDAVFNQEFFFDNITTEELDSKMLSIEVLHQSAQKLQKILKLEKYFKKLGKIYLTTSIEKEARRLTINLIKVDDLPKWGIIGAPDVCVRITLSQGSSPAQTKSSRVLKSTTNAVYKEAVMFLVSTKPSDLQHTKITISVHDLSRSVTGDDVIGSVYLGELAMDKSEVEQWKNTIGNIGKEYKGSHHLKSNRQNAPNVHVSETQSDGEDNNTTAADG